MAGFLSALRRIYLSLYNWTVFIGWFQVLYFAVKALREGGPTTVYDAVEKPLQLAQTAAVLEVLVFILCHEDTAWDCRIGEIASVSDFASNWIEIISCLGNLVEHSGGNPYTIRGHMFLLAPWLSAGLLQRLEFFWQSIIRYSFFGMKEALGFAPSWLLWLRYSTFLILYPTGITSEVGLIYVALPFIKASEKYCIRMPNKWNFTFDYFYASIIALAIYVPGMFLMLLIIQVNKDCLPNCFNHISSGSPHMYGYMLGQRKKALSKSKTA
ncbi:hypothetical protein ZIOFF_055902 [Zingiber officinale]|uniref:Very-long-chain (3R)-3-hydroxyacyl-CoA dehydratase n=1 Tax=Zingiber officinale TaxID=94328 RepID=A0A8J5FX74_ZINOF|nr:hypothetical protein ZIOFF_055902 [Zingiber officinale]